MFFFIFEDVNLFSKEHDKIIHLRYFSIKPTKFDILKTDAAQIFF